MTKVAKIWTLLLSVVLLGCSGARSSAADPLAQLHFANDSSRALAPRTISFGQVFRPGALKPGERTSLLIEGAPTPVQMDAKALYPDGSVRHAVMSVELPGLPAGKEFAALIVKADQPAPPTPSDTTYAAIPPLSVIVTLAGKSGRVVRLDLPEIARNQAKSSEAPWLQGPLAEERRFRADVTDQLQVVFDVYTPKRGPARVDVAFHHDWTTARASDEIVYDVEMRMGDATTYRARNVRHYAHANWHRLAWSDRGGEVRVSPRLADLQAAAAVPRYDPEFKVGVDLIGELAKAAQQLNDEPLSSASVTKYMPTSGGRWDIGPLPTWAAADLLRGNGATRRLLLANGDAAGAVPWHVREKGSELPLTIDKFPDLWLDSRAQSSAPLAETFDSNLGEWTPDDAHQPSLTYLPYLLTGLRYYKDELTQQAAYVLAYYDNNYRGGSAGLIIGADGGAWQPVRGLAWSLRTLASAAYLLPADDPMQAYFDAKLRGNLAKLVELYVEQRVMKSAGQLEGWMPGAYRPESAVAPWQQGYLAIVLGWVDDMGYADAGVTLRWMSNFLTGLFVRDGRFDARLGTAYILEVEDAKTGANLNTWTAAASASDLDGSSADLSYYGMIMRGALASAYRVKAAKDTKRAYDELSARMATQSGDPTFAVAQP